MRHLKFSGIFNIKLNGLLEGIQYIYPCIPQVHTRTHMFDPGVQQMNLSYNDNSPLQQAQCLAIQDTTHKLWLDRVLSRTPIYNIVI